MYHINVGTFQLLQHFINQMEWKSNGPPSIITIWNSTKIQDTFANYIDYLSNFPSHKRKYKKEVRYRSLKHSMRSTITQKSKQSTGFGQKRKVKKQNQRE